MARIVSPFASLSDASAVGLSLAVKKLSAGISGQSGICVEPSERSVLIPSVPWHRTKSPRGRATESSTMAFNGDSSTGKVKFEYLAKESHPVLEERACIGIAVR